MNKRQFLKSTAALCLTPFFPALSPKHKIETRDERILRKLPIKVNPLKPTEIITGVRALPENSTDDFIIKEIHKKCKELELSTVKNIFIWEKLYEPIDNRIYISILA